MSSTYLVVNKEVPFKSFKAKKHATADVFKGYKQYFHLKIRYLQAKKQESKYGRFILRLKCKERCARIVFRC